MTPLRWVLPYLPIAANHLYPTTVTRSGRVLRFLDHRAKRWKADAMTEVWASGAEAPEGPLALRIGLWPPDRRKRDADGTVKLVQDAVCEALGVDDSRVVYLAVHKHDADRDRARIEVEVAPLPAVLVERPAGVPSC